eukprot:Opistho-2@70372
MACHEVVYVHSPNALATFVRPSEVLSSSQFIAANSAHVTIPEDGVKSAARLLYETMRRTGFSVANWRSHELHPRHADAEALEWIFVVDTLNFSFWTEASSPPYVVRHNGKDYSGYWSLCAALNRALQEGVAITSAHFYATITEDQLAHIFRSETATTIPMLKERVRNLNQVGSELLRSFGGLFSNVVTAANGSAQRLLDIIADRFPCFRDIGEFKGRPVAFYKRAQILVADVWACFEGKDIGRFDDIATITMFADYRVPQGLVHVGALQYSDALIHVMGERLFVPGEDLESEIRGCSIWSVELLRREMELLQKADPHAPSDLCINAILIDFFLWDTAKQKEGEIAHIPIHRIRSIFY